ncbi:MAG TPA: hypothetical protein P5080_05070 [Candidatus Paceibacterota bacterium]|nr:hypothetical protein [Candidatus Pacearchaeota archaeon]HRZ51318.1 hypothetical protein [Candidatus Paceibacterota bacterium]HSA37040.1 hypothetical protein [Candidatus Paceibacterota bacterium]
MGRYYSSTKPEADYLKKIDISWLKQQGLLQRWHSSTISWTNGFTGDKSSIGIEVALLDDDKYARIHYTQTEQNGEKRDFDYRIPITSTPCNYGGQRYWFACPWYKNGVYCGRRVRTLYKAGDYFACRHCYNLTYSERNTNRRYRMHPLFETLLTKDKIDKLEKKIKKRFYAGKPTKKQQQLEKLYQRTAINYSRLKAEKMI